MEKLGGEAERGRKLPRGRKQEQEEEKEEEEEGENEGARHQRAGEDLWGHRVGPEGGSEERAQEAGSQDGQKEGSCKADRKQQQLLVFEQLGSCPRRTRQTVRRRSSSEEGLESFPWHSDGKHRRTDAAVGCESVGSTMGLGDREHPTHLQSILEDGAPRQDEWSHVQGKPNALLHSRPSTSRKSSGCERRGDAEAEKPRTDGIGGALFCSPETGISPPGGYIHVKPYRDFGGFKVVKGRPKSPSSSRIGLAKDDRLEGRRESEGQAARQGQREKQVGQQPRPKRGRAEEEGEVRGREVGTSCEVRMNSYGGEKMEAKEREACHEKSGCADEEEEVSQGSNREEAPGERGDVSTVPGCRPSPRPGEKVSQFFDKGLGLGGIANWLHGTLNDELKGFKPLRSHAKLSGSIFPLPETSEVIQRTVGSLTDEQVHLLRMVCLTLNSYYGVSGRDRPTPSVASTEALRTLAAYASDVSSWSEKFEGLRWED